MTDSENKEQVMANANNGIPDENEANAGKSSLVINLLAKYRPITP